MGCFIRKVKTASGATAVQIVRKERGSIISLTHIGSAHDEQQLTLLMSLARQRLTGPQQSLFTDAREESAALPEVIIERAVSRLLYDALESQYLRLGFGALNDQPFQQLCLARLVEPTSKLDSIRVLADMEAFRQRHGLIGITVVADAGMLSQDNLQALDDAGYTYIVGSRMHKIPYDIAEYQERKQELTDNQIITAKTGIADQRIIYQYRAKRAALDLRNIAKQIEKAEKIIRGTAVAKKAKFLSVTTKKKQLNQALIDKAKALAGIKGYVTNLPTAEASNARVIAYYHQLWHVEQSFRMSKHDLRARPIFHHQQEAIEAHLTVVMAALAIQRTIENATGLSLKRFIALLKPIRSGVVSIAGKEYPGKARISPEVRETLQMLS